MSIDIDLFKKESENLIGSFDRAMDYIKNRKYDKAINELDEVIISAGLLTQKYPEVGGALRLDKTILVAKGYQLECYALKLKDNPKRIIGITREMAIIARGNIDFANPYFKKIVSNLKEWNETSERGDFYTRQLED